ncbi:MAG TPA: DUF485 domain-containing protein [Solirubrobacteraceae bacterium]|nr:DUF485 domain-containing protein [Solirubrobacteraceae bacterium]HSD81236.1 DUF485 domain-containing protein [Solirubrobacteraceae bacterium]
MAVTPVPSGSRARDWRAIEALPEFRELVARRRRFVVPATIFFLTWYFGFIVAAGYAPDALGERVFEGVTVGYVWALTQFLMVAVLGVWYLRYSARVLDPLRARVAELAARRGEPRFTHGEREVHRHQEARS